MIFKFRMNYVTLYLNAYHLVSVKYLPQQSAYDIEHRDQLRKKNCYLLLFFLKETVKLLKMKYIIKNLRTILFWMEDHLAFLLHVYFI